MINQKNLVDYTDFIVDKPDLDNYKEITNYPRKTYFTKLKYKFPSLVKTGFNKFPSYLNLEIKTPILEENPYLNERNKNLFSIRSVFLDKENINKGFERKLPSFTLPERNKLLIEKEKKEKKEIKLLKKKFENYERTTKENGGSTTNKFFKSISKNILQNKFYVRNMKNTTVSLDKSDLFITRNQNNYRNEISKNNISNVYINEGKNIDNKPNRYRGRIMRGKNLIGLKFDKNYLDIIRTEKIIKNILSGDY